MLAYLSSSIWTSQAQTLVKTDNVDIPLPNSLKYLTCHKSWKKSDEEKDIYR
ncbi:MAG: hypothetical protein JRE64_25595 [Deltaproteobacteria bacterium]|nr:hypothetical protein [Deltaproteobacteria bacterium]